MYEKDLPWNWKLQDGKYFLTKFDLILEKTLMAFLCHNPIVMPYNSYL